MSSMKKGLRRVAAVAVTALVVAPALATVASATSTFAFDRLQGANRYATSVAVGTSFGASTNVILANGTNAHTVDALTASYLAGVKKAPIMLTQLAATPTDVLARITASGATDIWLVGGEGVISAAQAAALDVKFGTIHRLGGLDRFLTAEKIIAEGGAAASKTAIVTTGVNFPDALGAGPLSYVKGMPIGITGTKTLPAATLTALKGAGVTNAIVLGGPTVVTPAVVTALTAGGIVPFVGAGVTDGRIFGRDRAETSTKLADYMITNQGFSNTAVNVASGQPTTFGADALGGGALSGKEGRATLITGSSTSPGFGLIEFFKAHAATLASGHIFGGTAAVSSALADAMTAAAKTVASNQTYSVSPSTTTTKTVSITAGTTAQKIQGNISYTVTGLGTTPVKVALFPAANVIVSTGGVVTFVDTPGNNLADGYGTTTTANAKILSVNGVPLNATATATAVTPISGGISFILDSTIADSAVPVVFSDSGATTNQLDLVAAVNNDPKQPAESFAVGGVAKWNPAEFAGGPMTGGLVTSVNKTAGYLITAADGLMNYDANDNFTIGGIPKTFAQFVAALSTGDTIGGTYAPTPALVSTFNLTDTTPIAPTGVTATATGSSVTVTFTDAALADSYNVYRATAAAAAVNCTAVPAASYAVVGTATDGVTGLTQTGLAPNNYCYDVSTVLDGQESDVSGTPSFTSVVSPATSPKSVYAAETVMGGGLANTLDFVTTGDVLTFVFDRVINAPAAGSTIQLRDADGTIVNVVSGTNATFARNAAAVVVNGVSRPANTVLTTTMTATPSGAQLVQAGTTAGLQFSATVIDQAGITNGAAWNIAGSTDVTVEQ